MDLVIYLGSCIEVYTKVLVHNATKWFSLMDKLFFFSFSDFLIFFCHKVPVCQVLTKVAIFSRSFSHFFVFFLIF